MERNLRIYPYYQAARSSLFWLPVFFLYFAAALPIDQVLLLESIYYLGVVVLEVPSGYFSDRVGRRATLLISTAASVAAYAVFASTASFAPFAAAQVLLALAMAFNSGTDTALLYDSLAALDRGAEIGAVEARAQAWGFGALAVASLAGGALAGLDLRIAYLLSGVGAAVALALAVAFREPPARERAHPPLRQLTTVLGRLRDPTLAWVFALTVCLIVLAHVPYELFQPYLAFLLASGDPTGYQATPLAAGALAAAMMALSAVVGRRAIAIRDRLGAAVTLLGGLALLSLIMAAMAAVVHPLVVVLLMFRSVPMAVTRPIANAIIHPRLGANIRATYFSLQSLAGRLGFSASLAGASLAVGAGASLTRHDMARLLTIFAAAGAALIAALAVSRPRR